MRNTLPESAAITSPALIGYLVYMAVFAPTIMVPPHKLNRLLWPAFLCTCVTFAGALGWAIHANGGPGNLVLPVIKITTVEGRYAMVQGICTTAGAYTGGSVRILDWTRFTSTPNAPRPAMATSMPISMTIGALIGVLVTSATTEMYGFVQWNPLIMLQYVQAHHYTAACRAGTFFAGCGFFGSQIFVNITQNYVSSGMDFAGTFPRFITLRRGGFIVCFIGILIQPWRFLSQATILLSVIGSFSVFVAPMTGILVADYWLVRRRKWKIPDLYSNTGIYWYFYGLNWRAFLAFCIAWAPAMRKCLPSLVL
jgi:NCS1 family nucleobase:cation symporter-1